MKMQRYAAFGSILQRHRESMGLDQEPFALELGTSQQSLSRWERGVSRPRQEDFARIASVVRTSIEDLMQAAGYVLHAESTEVAALSFDKPFPFNALSPESFERFCATLLHKKYGKAERLGGQGHTQNGFDIVVRLHDLGVLAFQCKRTNRFGPADVEKAVVAAATFVADRKVLLLSRIASPEARNAAFNHGWELWDQDGISREARQLSRQDRLDLVDDFFRGKRLELLGEDEPGAWQSLEQFFAPFQAAELLGHSWGLSGREIERKLLEEALLRHKSNLTLLVGPGGVGKSRLLLAALQDLNAAAPHTRIRILDPNSSISQKSLEGLGTDETLLVVDDCHDRDDWPALLRHVVTQPNCRLLLSLRPYGLGEVQRQSSQLSIFKPPTITLAPLAEPASMTLALEVLKRNGASKSLAKEIARLAEGSPLFIILAAHVASSQGIHPQFIGTSDEFHNRIFLEFQSVVTKKLASDADAPTLDAILNTIALLQPLPSDEIWLVDFLNKVSGVARGRVGALLKVLIDAGVLFKRGRTLRLAPDLLADFIIEKHCYTNGRSSTGNAEALAEAVSIEHLPNLLFNLGRLDWRRSLGEFTPNPVADAIWARLDANSWLAGLTVAMQAALFYPQHALTFAKQVIAAKEHSRNKMLFEVLGLVTRNQQLAKDALRLLWELTKNDRRPIQGNQDHPGYVLKQLASPDPTKQSNYLRTIVQFLTKTAERSKQEDEVLVLLEIIEASLKLTGQKTSANQRTMSIMHFSVPLDVIGPIRKDVIETLLTLLASDSAKVAYNAAKCIGRTLSPPLGYGKEPIVTLDGFEDEAVATMLLVLQEIKRRAPSDVVKAALAKAVAWHATWGTGRTNELAKVIVAALGDDTRYACVLMLMDLYGTFDRKRVEAVDFEELDSVRQAFVERLLVEHPQKDSLELLLSSCVQEIEAAGESVDLTNQRFLSRIINSDFKLAEEVLQWHMEGKVTIFQAKTADALAAIVRKDRDFACEMIARLYEHGHVGGSLKLLAATYGSVGPAVPIQEIDHKVLRAIFSSTDADVLGHAVDVARRVAFIDPLMAIGLLTMADLATMGLHGVFMLMANDMVIPLHAVTNQDAEKILNKLVDEQDVDDYFFMDFLKRLGVRDASLVGDFVIARSKSERSKYHPLTAYSFGREDGGSLDLLGAPNGRDVMYQLLDTAMTGDPDENGDLSFSFGRTFRTLFGPFGAEMLGMLREWMTSEAHVDVVWTLLSEADTYVWEKFDVEVCRLLDAAESISGKSVELLIDALVSSAVSGVRIGTPGEPYKADIDMKAEAEKRLSRLTGAEPVYEFYRQLVNYADLRIKRQRDVGKRMDEEEG